MYTATEITVCPLSNMHSAAHMSPISCQQYPVHLFDDKKCPLRRHNMSSSVCYLTQRQELSSKQNKDAELSEIRKQNQRFLPSEHLTICLERYPFLPYSRRPWTSRNILTAAAEYLQLSTLFKKKRDLCHVQGRDELVILPRATNFNIT
ncbi:hypothetical protein TNCV_1899401 [Trichonephila clavipes]|nr:hypothetical protein TNCV_1899401 [Trichonephila clavipes]